MTKRNDRREYRAWCTIAEAAADLGVTRQRVHQLLAQRGIEAERAHGRLLLFPRSALAGLRVRAKPGRPWPKKRAKPR